MYAHSTPALWDRLVARSRALLPSMTGDEISRILHGLHVGGAYDESLLEDILIELDEGEISFRGPNDFAVFAHALALHRESSDDAGLRKKLAGWLFEKCFGPGSMTLTASDLSCLLRGLRQLLVVGEVQESDVASSSTSTSSSSSSQG